jgi:drug/metabolite transporter (DMT)-like permease
MGVFWSFLSAFLWSTTFVCARYLLAGKSIDPITLSTLRFAIGAFILLAFGLVWCRRRILAIRLRDFAHCLLMASFGVVGMGVLLFFGQQHTSAINSSIIMQVCPIFIFLLGIFIGERFTAVGFLGIVVSLAGTAMLMNVLTTHGLQMNFSLSNRGDLLVIGSAACWAVYAVFSKPLVNNLGGYAATTWVMVAGALELAVLRLAWPAPVLLPGTAFEWTAVVYMAIFPTAIAFFAWYEAMRLIRLSLLNVMQYLTPVFTIVLAWALLGERMTLWQVAGIAVIMLGIMLVSRRRGKPRGT